MTRALLKMIIRKYWKIMLGMILICALGCATMTGLTSGSRGLDSTLKDYIHSYGLADATITTAETAGQQGLSRINAQQGLTEKLQAVPGIVDVDPRFTYNTVLAEKNGRHSSVRMLFYSPDDRLKLNYRERAPQSETAPKYADSVQVEYKFARAHHIRAGDTLSLRTLTDKDKYRSYRVDGLVSTPETLAVTATDGMKAVTPDLGYIYAPREVLKTEVDPEYKDQLARLKKKEQDLRQARADAGRKYRAAITELDHAQTELAQAEEQFRQALPKLNKKLAKLRKARKKLRHQLSQAREARKELSTQKTQLEEQRTQILEALDALEKSELFLNQIEASLDQPDLVRSIIQQLRRILILIDEQLDFPLAHRAIRFVLDFLDKLDPTDPEQMENAINQARSLIETQREQLLQALAKVEDGLLQIQQKSSDLDRAQKKLKKALKKVNKGMTAIRSRIANAQRELEEGAARIQRERAEAKAAWQKAKSRFRHAKKKLKSARADLEEWKEYETWCNQYLLYFSADAPRQETLQAAEEAIENTDGAEILSSVLYEDSAVKADIDANVVPLQKMAVFVPVLMFGMSLMVVFLFLSLMILQMRREIGIFRALGSRKGPVRAALSLTGLIIALSAALLGVVTAFALGRFMDSYFQNYFAMPMYDHEFLISRFLLSCVIIAVVCQAAVLLAASVIDRIQPAEAMSRTVPSAAKISPLLRRLTAGLQPLAKFCVLSLLRNRRRFLFSAICLASSVVLIFTALSFVASKDAILEETFGQRIHYDCQAFFQEKPTAEVLSRIDALEGVSDVQPASYYGTDVQFEGKREHVVINGMEEGSDLVGNRDADDKALSIPGEGILLEEHTARNLGVKTGDSVQINGASLPVVGIPHQSIERVQYVSGEQAKSLGDPAAWMVMCRVTKDGEKALSACLSDEDAVAVVVTRAVKARIADIFRTLDLYIWAIVIFSALIGMIIIDTTSQHNLLEVKVQLCTLRSLGFHHSEVSRFWFIQSLLHYAASCIIGLAVGRPVAGLVLHLMEDPQKEYPFSEAVWPWFLTLGVVFVYVVLSHLWAMRRLRRWDLAEATKGRE